ncbi:VWA domain-containing protein [Brevibacillus laterosporus]|uniref:vWA domain-containing protein n=1 Tax=Brevibacillus laterosporus TaxID=1465 RepID=UPI002405F9A0|nr:vWA domain-containing protein [Brevibacillus laterosporus]MDF9410368.1 VWA domain-containing protein [Brevibacillus laterosporus]
MSQKKISLLMVFCSLIGGIIGFVVGEMIVNLLSNELPQWVVMGLYFGQYALFVGLMCLIAELISPRLNGQGWRQRYVGFSWKMLVPSTFIMLGVVAMLLQFFYGTNFQKASGSNNIVMLLDISSSMQESDKDNQLFKSAADVVRRMDANTRVAVITFNQQASVLQPLVLLSNQKVRDDVIQKLNSHEGPSGGTDIEEALQTALNHINRETNNSGNNTVILMSDGYSDVDLDKSLQPFKQSQIIVHTVGMSTVSADGTQLLKRIAEETNGNYYDIKHTDQITGVFGQIYDMSRQDRELVKERVGATEHSLFYAILRVVSLLVIGALLGLAVGLFFDNKYIAKGFTLGGIVSGLLAGLILEKGLASGMYPAMGVRLVADLLLAAVMPLFTIFIPMPNQALASEKSRFTGGRYLSAKNKEAKQISTNKFDR